MRPGHSYVLLGNELPKELTDTVELIDQLHFDAACLDIKSAREVVASAIQQPFGTRRLLVVTNADQLSHQIQNTLLKLLEEPPTFLIIVLVTVRPEALLPTVRSRLHQLGARSAQPEVAIGENGILAADELRVRLGQAKDRPGLVSTLEQFRVGVKQALLANPSIALVSAYELLDRSVRRLNQNANQKLVVDALLLNWPL